MKINKLKEKFRSMSLSKKVQLCVAVLSTLALAVAIPVAAWFAQEKRLALLTKVNAPSSLYINAGNREDIVNLDISKINVEEKDDNGNPIEEKYYVFCVQGDNVAKYDLQIAHTTNIPFTYTLYTAVENNSSYDATYNDDHHYKIVSEVTGGYINSNTTRVLADGTLKSRSYDGTDDVQIYAEPAYWKANPISTTLVDRQFCDFYILKVSWSQTKGAWNYVTNDKETDMIYITAAVHNS